jgi:hypothetical protein
VVDKSADQVFALRIRRAFLLSAFLFLFNRFLYLILNADCNQNAKYIITKNDGTGSGNDFRFWDTH